MEIINIEAGTFREMVMSIQLLKEKLENLKGNQTSKSLDDWMDNQEVCMALNISQRTLQAMRSNGTLKKGRKDNPDKSEANPYKQTTLHSCKRLYLTVRCEV